MAGAATRRLPAEHRPVRPNAKFPGPALAEGSTASLVVLCAGGNDVASDLGALRARFPDAACLVLCPRPDPEVARTALRWGGRSASENPRRKPLSGKVNSRRLVDVFQAGDALGGYVRLSPRATIGTP
jgi:hypothetical protein